MRLKSKPFYYEDMNIIEAKDIIRKQRVGTFLFMRRKPTFAFPDPQSEVVWKADSFSGVMGGVGVLSIIEEDDGLIYLVGKNLRFSSIDELLAQYSNPQLNAYGDPKLFYPLYRNSLQEMCRRSILNNNLNVEQLPFNLRKYYKL